MPEKVKRFCVIRELATGKEVHRFETTGHMERAVEAIERGVIAQMDKEKYYCCDEGEDGRPWRHR